MAPDAVQPSPVVIEFSDTLGEALRADAAASRTHRRIFSAIYVTLGVVCLFSCVTFNFHTGKIHLDETLLGVGAVLLTVPIWRPMLQRYLVGRRHSKRGSARKAIAWTITADALHAKTTVSESRIDWGAINTARETDEGFLLYTHPRFGQWLPKHGFKSEADIDRLRILIEQHVPTFTK